MDFKLYIYKHINKYIWNSIIKVRKKSVLQKKKKKKLEEGISKSEVFLLLFDFTKCVRPVKKLNKIIKIKLNYLMPNESKP